MAVSSLDLEAAPDARYAPARTEGGDGSPSATVRVRPPLGDSESAPANEATWREAGPEPMAAATDRRGEVFAEDLAGAAERARLIGDICRLIREPTVPEVTRSAGLTLIGWLARRRPDECAHAVGVEEARTCEQRTQSVRAKARRSG